MCNCEWRDIETAPKDGTVFLGYKLGQFRECYKVPRDDCDMWCFGGTSGADDLYPNIKPTHWMPLPKPPAMAQSLAQITTSLFNNLHTGAALELEVARLRSVMADVIKAHGYAGGTPVEVMSTPFTPTTLLELIEKVEKMTIERCAKAVWNSKPSQKAIDEIPAAYQLASLAAIRAIPIGQIKLEELL